MEVKDKVKQRRNEKIKSLKEAARRVSPAEPLLRERTPITRNENPELTYSRPEWTRQMEDPEYAWYHKMKNDPVLSGGADVNEERWKEWLETPSRKQIWVKLAITVILFGMVWSLFRIDRPWAAKGREFVSASLTESFDFQAVSAWYEQRFGGSPSFIPSFRDRSGEEAVKASTNKRTYFSPVKGNIVSGFDVSHSVIRVQTKPDVPVYAMDTGQVIFAGQREETGYTVMIRHPNGYQSIYGFVSEARVEVNDWMKGGEAIGKVSKETEAAGILYFGVLKDGLYINPTDVISFD